MPGLVDKRWEMVIFPCFPISGPGVMVCREKLRDISKTPAIKYKIEQQSLSKVVPE